MNQEQKEAARPPPLQQRLGGDGSRTSSGGSSVCDGSSREKGSSDGGGGGEGGDGDEGSSDNSTQCDGASAEWSDTASYTSDRDGPNDDDGDGGRGEGGRAFRHGSGGGRDNSRPSETSGTGLAGRVNRACVDGRRKSAAATTVSRNISKSSNCNGDDGESTGERGEGGRRQTGQRGLSRDAGNVQDVDSTTSSSEAAANGDDSSEDDDVSDDDSDDDVGDDDCDGDSQDGGSSSGNDAEDPLEPIQGEVKLVPSMFPDRPPTVFFEYPKELGMARFNNVYFTEPLGSRRLLFKSHWERNSVKNAFFRAGFSRTRSTVSWTASWGKHPTREGFRNLNRFQKVNHFPGSWCIGRKDRLMRTLAKHKREINGAAAAATAAAAAAAASMGGIQKSGGGGGRGEAGGGSRSGSSEWSPTVSSVDITPDGFVLPADRRAWLKAVDADPKAIWIVKPPASSCGRGIRVINKASVGSVGKSKKGLVQRYIHNPMLIGGRKFDLRLYVLVTSMEPLRVYMFEEGLVRFSTKEYSLRNLRSRFTHLTNYSINKKSGSFQAPDDSDGQEAKESTNASKWALTFFWKYLEKAVGKQKFKEVQRSIEEVVLRTMAAADGDMTTNSHQFTRHRGCCYELFGFDVLLDEHLKPWLLEVNISPSLFGSSALDRRIKGTLMADIFHLVGFRPFDRMALRREERREAKHIPGTRRAVRAVVGRPQDAWRWCQTPASINLAELGEEEWEVIRDTEDEQHRAGHFRILYPTAENVTRLWAIFRSPRFLNGVLARWVLTGGLSNARNRQDIGLIAERLATLGGAHRASGKELGLSASVDVDGRKNGTGKGKGRGFGSDGRWEETTSNATTLLSTGRRGNLSGAAPWSGKGGERPASSATSRASQPSEVRRPSCCGARGGGRRSGKVSAVKAESVGEGGGAGGCVGTASSEVPRLQLRRMESKVVVPPSLLTLRTPILSGRKFGGGDSVGSSSRRLDPTPRSKRASSASSSRPPSTGRSSVGGSGSGRGHTGSGVFVSSLNVNQLSIGRCSAVNERWESQCAGGQPALCSLGAAATAATKNFRSTPRRRPQLHNHSHHNHHNHYHHHKQHQQHQQYQNSQQRAQEDLHQEVKPSSGRSSVHLSVQPVGLGHDVSGTAAMLSPLHATAAATGSFSGKCFPRPPCRAAEIVEAEEEGSSGTGLVPSGCFRRTSSKGSLSCRSLSGASLRSRGATLTDSSRPSVIRAYSTVSISSHAAGLLDQSASDSRASKGGATESAISGASCQDASAASAASVAAERGGGLLRPTTEKPSVASCGSSGAAVDVVALRNGAVRKHLRGRDEDAVRGSRSSSPSLSSSSSSSSSSLSACPRLREDFNPVGHSTDLRLAKSGMAHTTVAAVAYDAHHAGLGGKLDDGPQGYGEGVALLSRSKPTPRVQAKHCAERSSPGITSSAPPTTRVLAPPIGPHGGSGSGSSGGSSATTRTSPRSHHSFVPPVEQRLRLAGAEVSWQAQDVRGLASCASTIQRTRELG